MSHLKYFSLLVLWATYASQECFVRADSNQNLTAITWAHAVNSQEKLNNTLTDGSINMIEADVVLGTVGTDKTAVPIMAHPPNKTSDLSLTDFLAKVDTFNKNTTAMKGVKLDFKTIEAFEKSADILSKYAAANYSIWLNADILKGPGNASADPVDGKKFLAGATKSNKWGLSLGWTTSTSNSSASYTVDHVMNMRNLIKQYNIPGTRFTFPVRAMYAAESINELMNLTDSVNGSTLTIWSPDEDDVDIDHLRHLVKTVGLSKTFVDVPESISAKLRLDTLSSGSSMNMVVFPMYVLSLIVGLRHVLFNAINRI